MNGRFVFATSLLLTVAPACFVAAAAEPWPRAGQAIQAAAKVLAEGHVSRRPLDDEFSRRWFDEFFATLDSKRMFFLKSDIREFEPSAEQLDDFARHAKFEFPPQVRRRFQQRVAQAAAYAEAFAREKHDYTIDEDVPRRYETYAADDNALRERWRKRLKLEILAEKSVGRDPAVVGAELAARYRALVRQVRRMTDMQLCEIYLKTLAKLYDRHSDYLSPEVLGYFSS
jgi:carboxyl-terminal processing protease